MVHRFSDGENFREPSAIIAQSGAVPAHPFLANFRVHPWHERDVQVSPDQNKDILRFTLAPTQDIPLPIDFDVCEAHSLELRGHVLRALAFVECRLLEISAMLTCDARVFS